VICLLKKATKDGFSEPAAVMRAEKREKERGGVRKWCDEKPFSAQGSGPDGAVKGNG